MTRSIRPVGAPLFHTGDFLPLLEQGRLDVAADFLRRRVGRVIAAGFDALELTLDAVHSVPAAFDDAFIAFLASAEVAGRLALTAHLPFMGLALLSPLDEVREQSLARIREAYDRVCRLPVCRWIVHLDAAFPAMLDNADCLVREEHARRVRERGHRSLECLLEFVPHDALLVENLPSMPLANAAYWADTLDLGVCLDAGHILLRRETFAEHLAALGPRVRELHVHDLIERGGSRLDHQALGTGTVPTDELRRLADAAPADAPVILEMPLDAACESLRVWREEAGA